MRRTFVLLVVALVTSLALNIILWFRATEAEAIAATTSNPDPTLALAELHIDDVCLEWRTELAQCEDARWQSIVRTISAGDAGLEVTSSPEAVMQVPPTGRGADEDFQEEMLCTIAVQHLRHEWESQREQTTRNIARSLADEEERRATLHRDLTTYGAILELSETERASFAERYEPLWNRRVAAIREGLEADPPDGRRVFEMASQLFEDEDTLVRQRYGSDALRRFRLAQAEKRTAVLALLASHAEIPWDSSINW